MKLKDCKYTVSCHKQLHQLHNLSPDYILSDPVQVLKADEIINMGLSIPSVHMRLVCHINDDATS